LETEVTLLKEDVRRIAAATQQLLQIASPTLEEPALVDVNDVVVRALATSQAVAPRCTIQVNKCLQSGVPKVWGWATELERCFRNIIDNAVEAMGGEGTLTVRTRWLPEVEAVEVSIHDTGEGIPSEHVQRVREPFFTTRKHRRALGLGLAVAYHVALQHGGDLKIESLPRRGTTVTVTVQRARTSLRRQATWREWGGAQLHRVGVDPANAEEKG
jgi:two-component system NtrC family sensor kinase